MELTAAVAAPLAEPAVVAPPPAGPATVVEPNAVVKAPPEVDPEVQIDQADLPEAPDTTPKVELFNSCFSAQRGAKDTSSVGAVTK